MIAFDAQVIEWELDDYPPTEFARHHIKEASFYGREAWTLDLTIKLPESSSASTREDAAAITTALRTFKPAMSPECKAPAACKRALRDVLLCLSEEHVDELASGNPFTPWDDFGLAVCPPCTNMVQERSKKEQKAVWDRLPALLRIEVPGWGEEPQAPGPPPPAQP